MAAKKGRKLLKKHYVALLQDAGIMDAGKKKVSVLKNLFWSDAEMVRKYTNHEDAESGSDNVGSVCRWGWSFCGYAYVLCMCESTCVCV